MKNFAILFLIAIFFCGCSTTYTVLPKVNNDNIKRKPKGQPLIKAYSYEQMNEKLFGQHATIELRDGREIYAQEIQIVDDSVSWLEEWKYEKPKASIVQLDKIIIKNHALGAWEGMGLGLLGGSVIGTTIGSEFFRGEGGIGGFLIGTLAGIVFGGIILGEVGHSYIYEFPLAEPSDSLRNGDYPQK